MTRVEIGEHLVIDPEICHGQMTFRGTRVPVDTVLAFLKLGYSVDMLLHEWPELSRPAIQEAIELARKALLERYAAQIATASPAS